MNSDFLEKIQEWKIEAKAYPLSVLVHRDANKFSGRIIELISAYEKQAEALAEAKRALEKIHTGDPSEWPFFSCRQAAKEALQKILELESGER